MMFTSALLQYNSSSHAVSANVRLRWEYRPGSELFVVFNEDRDTLARRFPSLTGPRPHRENQPPVSTVSRFSHTNHGGTENTEF